MTKPRGGTIFTHSGPTPSYNDPGLPVQRNQSQSHGSITPSHRCSPEPAPWGESTKLSLEVPPSHYCSPANDSGSPESSPGVEPILSLNSPASSNGSAKFVQFSDSAEYFILGRDPPKHFPCVPKSSPKSALKRRKLNTETLPSLFAGDRAVYKAIHDILTELIARVKKFKPSTELDFSANTESPLILAKVEKNMAFISQLQKLYELLDRLERISTNGNPQLENMHEAARVAIEQTLQRMKAHQLKLYERFTVKSSLEQIAKDLIACIEQFECPYKLDFSTKPGDDMILRNTERNKPFIDQLRRLSRLQAALGKLPPYRDEQLQEQHATISRTIDRAFQGMEARKLVLYKQYLARHPLDRPARAHPRTHS